LTAVADDETAFSCETRPASPGLCTRTGMCVLLAPSCFAAERAAAVWSDFASCPIACVPEPACPWFAPWWARFRFPAAAAEETLFDCSTSPSSPGLWTRTEMFVFFAPDCSALEAAAAVCSLSASCPIACVPVPPAEAWSADCPVPFAFAAVAPEATVFDCDTFPSWPGLCTRTEMFSLLAPCCVAYESALAAWLDFASWPTACVPPPSQPHEPACVWSADWPVTFAFPAVAFEATVLDCVTSPPEPGLCTRTEMFWFAG
jgi:hypothetical protein